VLRLRSLLILLAGGMLLAPAASPQVALPFTLRLQQAGTAVDIADGATIFLAADAIGVPATATLTVTYRGTDQAQISQISTSGATDFSVSAAAPPLSLSPGDSFTVALQYLPTTSKAQSGQVTFTYVERNRTATFRVNLSGTAPEFAFVYTPPSGNAVQVLPGATLAFPATPVSGTALGSFSLVNRGSGAGKVNAISVAGDFFELRGLPLLPAQVDAGRDLRFSIAFLPAQAATARATLSLDIPSQAAVFVLEGAGASPAYSYEVIRDGSTSPAVPNQTIALPDTLVKETTTVTLRVTNTGNADGQIAQIAVSGDGYRLSNLPFLPATLPVGASLTFTLSFTPSAVGSFPGRLRIGADEFPLAGSGAGALLDFQVTVAGTPLKVTPGGTVVLTPAAVGSSSSATFQVTNSGTRPAVVNAISVVKGDSFTLPDLPGFPLTLAPGASVNFTIRFAPKATGSLSDTLRIDDLAFTLSGAGNPPPALPAYRFEGPSGAQPPRSQPAISLLLAAPYPLKLTGTLTLGFASDVFAADPAVQFATGGKTVEFTIPANSTQAVFPNNASQIRLQTGTVAGTITITPSFLTEGGLNVTPESPRVHVITVERAAPQILGVTVTQSSVTAMTVLITGFATSRSVRQIELQFAPVAGETLGTTSLSINAETAFDAWYASSQSIAFGSQFTATVPLQFSGQTRNVAGPANAVQSITVSLANALGGSNPVSVTLPR
jgi:hypothetical protein